LFVALCCVIFSPKDGGERSSDTLVLTTAFNNPDKQHQWAKPQNSSHPHSMPTLDPTGSAPGVNHRNLSRTANTLRNSSAYVLARNALWISDPVPSRTILWHDNVNTHSDKPARVNKTYATWMISNAYSQVPFHWICYATDELIQLGITKKQRPRETTHAQSVHCLNPLFSALST
jgi:hypothetical protein